MQVVEKTVEIPQLPRDPQDKSLTCPLLSTTGALWFRYRKLEIYGPDHRDFTVAAHLKGGRCPAGAVHRVPHFMAVAVEKGFFARFTGLFRTPSTWTSSARLAATFF